MVYLSEEPDGKEKGSERLSGIFLKFVENGERKISAGIREQDGFVLRGFLVLQAEYHDCTSYCTA